jgi:hypothetical protein
VEIGVGVRISVTPCARIRAAVCRSWMTLPRSRGNSTSQRGEDRRVPIRGNQHTGPGGGEQQRHPLGGLSQGQWSRKRPGCGCSPAGTVGAAAWPRSGLLLDRAGAEGIIGSRRVLGAPIGSAHRGRRVLGRSCPGAIVSWGLRPRTGLPLTWTTCVPHFNGDRSCDVEAGTRTRDSRARIARAGRSQQFCSDGWGTVRDIGEKFPVHPATGTGSLTVPIALRQGAPDSNRS